MVNEKWEGMTKREKENKIEREKCENKMDETEHIYGGTREGGPITFELIELT